MTEKILIQVIGKGCRKCDILYENALKAVEELGKSELYEVEHFTEIEEFANLGVFITPGLLIDGKVVSEGRILNTEKIKQML
jgi:small redox-active disulfide protein 2